MPLTNMALSQLPHHQEPHRVSDLMNARAATQCRSQRTSSHAILIMQPGLALSGPPGVLQSEAKV